MPQPTSLPYATALVAALLGPPSARAQKPVAEFTFELRGDRVYVPVSIDGSPLHWLILDTGASQCSIDETLAATLHLASTPVASIRGAGAGSLRVARTGPVTLTVGGVVLRVPQIGVSPLDPLLRPYSGRPELGIIGRDFFEGRIVEMDFERRVIRVWPADANLATSHTTTVPVRVDGVPHATATLIGADGSRDSLDVIVDLGAKLALHVTERTMARLHLETRFTPTVYTPLAAGVGGETHYRMARAAGLHLGDAPSVRGTVIGLSADGTLTATYYDALLGLPYLRRFHLVIDYPHARMLLTPTPALGTRELFDRSGIFFVADGDTLRVRTLLASSPARSANVHVGDAIIAVDGRAVAAADLLRVRAMLADPTRTRASLRLGRDGTVVEAAIVLRDLLP